MCCMCYMSIGFKDFGIRFLLFFLDLFCIEIGDLPNKDTLVLKCLDVFQGMLLIGLLG